MNMFDNDEIGFDGWDTSDVDPSDCESKPTISKVGKYHLEVVSVKPRPEKENEDGTPRRPDILLTCVVLHSVKGQSPEGSLYYENVIAGGKGGGQPEEWAKKATCAFLHGVGLLRKEGQGDAAKFIDPETGTTRIDFGKMCAKLEALQFVADIKKEKGTDGYDDKFKLSFGRGAYTIGHPAVSDVPLNKEAAQTFLGRTGGGSKPPTDKPPASPPASPDGDDELAGL